MSLEKRAKTKKKKALNLEEEWEIQLMNEISKVVSEENRSKFYCMVALMYRKGMIDSDRTEKYKKCLDYLLNKEKEAKQLGCQS